MIEEKSKPKEKNNWTWHHILLIISVGILLIASVAAFTLYGLNRANSHRLFHEEEVGGYLNAIADATVLGGPLHVIQNLVSGDYAEANRQPIYIYIFAAFYRPEYDFFNSVKSGTFYMGVAMILIIGLVTYWRLGLFPFVLTTAFLAINQYLIFQGTLISCESMLLVFFFLAWIFLAEGYEKPSRYILGALFLGLAYMTKGTGIYLLGMFGLALIIVYNRHIFSKLLKRKEIWLAALVFLVISGPLYIRNYKVYGTPLYNVNMDYMWLDSFGQHYWAGDHSFQPFLERHSWTGIKDMFMKGMADELDSLQNLLRWEFATEKQSAWYVNILFAVLFFFIVGLIGDKNRLRSVMTFLLFVFFFVFFSWWARYSTLLRFMLPIIPILLAYAGLGIATTLKLISRLIKKEAVIKTISKFGWLIPLIASGLLFLHYYPSMVAVKGNPRYLRRTIGTYELRDGYDQLVKWQQATLKDGDKLFTGHDGTFQTRWLVNKKVSMGRFTLFEKPEEFNEYLDQEKPDYLIFHTKPWRDVERMLEPYVRWDKGKRVFNFLAPLPNYQVVEFPGTELNLYLVYQRVNN